MYHVCPQRKRLGERWLKQLIDKREEDLNLMSEDNRRSIAEPSELVKNFTSNSGNEDPEEVSAVGMVQYLRKQ